MSEAIAKIVRLERNVMWRKRLLSLQDGLAMAVIIGGLIAGAFAALTSLRVIGLARWAGILSAISLAVAAALIRWLLARRGERDAAFLIDSAFNLEDRMAASSSIIERGGPTRPFEEALIEDAARRIENQRAASVVPFRIRRWYAYSLVSVLVLAAALTIPARTVPITEALASERADIENAGEHLERTAAEIEQLVPRGTETAALAKEQAEVGRGFRLSTATRVEALRRLNALEERIRQRHDDLANTRANEIVSLADRRLGATLSTLSTPPRRQSRPDEDQPVESIDTPRAASKPNKADDRSPESTAQKHERSSQRQSAKSDTADSPTQTQAKLDQPDATVAKARAKAKSEPQKRPQEPVSGKGDRKTESAKRDSTEPEAEIAKETGEPVASTDQKPGVQKPADSKADAATARDQNAGERKGDQPVNELPAGSLEALKAIPDSLAEQAAKALPKMSEELLKKAAELRANELSPADLEKLRKAAESLSGDLSHIAQSKELQKALQEMARQVRPEQIEQVARELEGQEKLKQELEAAARLLMENQQAKEMVAGLAGQFAHLRDEGRNRDNSTPSGDKADTRRAETASRNQGGQDNRANEAGRPGKSDSAAIRRLAGQGRESRLTGKLPQGSGGEYLYLQSKAGGGAARAPYSSAYPQYRREAERSVQRSQVPSSLRQVVRKYFEAINPDAKR